MNELILTGLTMDSREIAELTGKEHRNVMADIREQLGKLDGGVLRFQHSYLNVQNKEQPCFKLPYRETMILISGYSVELRARIVDRWLELERASAPRIPKTYAEALQLAADQAKEIEAKSLALEKAAPKIEAFNDLMRSENTMSITQAAKHFGLHPKTEVFPYLRAHGYLTQTDLPTQAALDAQYLAQRQNVDRFGICHPQAVVLTSQLEHWRAHVVKQIKRWAGEIS
jgi:phage regulator Rha-like protein